MRRGSRPFKVIFAPCDPRHSSELVPVTMLLFLHDACLLLCSIPEEDTLNDEHR